MMPQVCSLWEKTAGNVRAGVTIGGVLVQQDPATMNAANTAAQNLRHLYTALRESVDPAVTQFSYEFLYPARQNPNAAAEGKPLAKISESSLKNVAKTIDDYDFINSTAGQAADILDDIKSGKLDLGFLNNPANAGRNMAGLSNDQSRAYTRYTRFVQDLVNSNLRLNNGVQTEGDAWRELKSIAANGTSYDNATAAEALERVIDKANGAASRGRAHLESRKKTFGEEPFEGYNDTVNGWQVRLDAINERRKAYNAAKPEAAPAAPAKGGTFKVIRSPY